MSIKVENLVCVYSKDGPFESRALDNVSFEIEDGSFVGIIGHTGSGKSTLIQHFNGLLKPESGKVFVEGVDITQKGVDMKKIRSKVGIVFQYPEYQLFEETVLKDIAYGPLNLGITGVQMQGIIEDVCKLLKIDESLLNKSPFELSGGQKRKVAIAGVLAMNPDILVLDEPTAGLDPKGREELLQIISSLHKNSKKTVIMVSHSMEDIARFAQKVLVMSHGRVALYDTVENVFKERELLKSIGLSLPEISKVAELLSNQGVHIGENIYTVEDAYNAIVKYIGKRSSKC